MSVKSYIKGIANAFMGRQQGSAAGNATRKITQKLRYHAGQDTGKERADVEIDPKSEDAFWLDDWEKAAARARDQLRNFPVLGWIIDKHLDFTTELHVEFKCGDETDSSKERAKLNDQLESLLDWWSKAENFDVNKRYSLYHYLRVNEAQKVLMGDMGTLKMADGRVMAVVADQIRNGFGYGWHGQNWFRGVRTHSFTGEALEYSFCGRNIDGSLNERDFIRVPAGNFYLHAERKHYPNLIRGVSPLASALNSIQDCYEGINWHLVKMKIAAMFGVVLLEDRNNLEAKRYVDPVTNEVVEEKPGAKYNIEMNGVRAMSMERTESVHVIESKIPATESQEFYKMVMMVSLKALNIPYSFFSEDFTNFYGSRGAVMHYVRSSEAPRQANISFLNNLLKWRITKWITDGYFELPRNYDVRKIRWRCNPRNIPIWDPSKEMPGIIMQINHGLTSYQQVSAEMGTNFYNNIDLNKEAREYAKQQGQELPAVEKGTPTPNNAKKEENNAQGN